MAMPASEQRIHIRGGRVIDPASDINAPLDVFVAGGRIAAVGNTPDGFTATLPLTARPSILFQACSSSHRSEARRKRT